MSSKFFTWTKGDRNNATIEALRSRGIIPIPVECITIKELDFDKPEKGFSRPKKRPQPIEIDGSPTPSSKQNSKPNRSIAVHDAALKSATTLITAMNDMLCPPQHSAHFQGSRLYLDSLPDAFCRPRANTAPPTPLAEAPQEMDPVELPGSLPEDRKSYQPSSQFEGFACHMRSSKLGEKILRPRSSPQEASGPLVPRRGRMSVHSYYRDAASIYTSHNVPDREQSGGIDELLPTYDAGNPTFDGSTYPAHNTWSRPSNTNLPLEIPQTFYVSTTLGSSVDDWFVEPPAKKPTLQAADVVSNRMVETEPHAEAILVERISEIRASHDAYVRSLKDAHEKEIALQRAYICFLESRQKKHSNESQGVDIGARALCEGAEANSLNKDISRSLLQPSERPDNDSWTSSANVETSQPILTPNQEAHEDVKAIRKERNELRESVEKKEQKISHLKGIARELKDNEKALRTTIAGLQARLVIANNERTDVLEGFNEATVKLQSLANREKLLNQELMDLQRRLTVYESARAVSLPPMLPKPLRIKHKRTFSDVGATTGTWPPMSQTPRILGDRAHSYQSAKDDVVGDPCMFAYSELDQPKSVSERGCKVEKFKMFPDAAQAGTGRRKQDLRKAGEKIKSPEAISDRVYPAPQQESPMSVRSPPNAGSSRRRPSGTFELSVRSSDLPEPGLGISVPQSLPRPATPDVAPVQRPQTRATPPPKSSAMSSPSPARAKTPLSTHKKLPKPPHVANAGGSPASVASPRLQAQRSETLRSFSDTIVTSHLKSAPKQEVEVLTSYNTDLQTPRLLDASVMPISKFASRQVIVPAAEQRCT